MRSREILFAALLLVGACGSDGARSGDDAALGAADGAIVHDAVSADASLEPVTEMEPNDGVSEGDVNVVSLPVLVQGAIDVADDIDIFTVDLTAGALHRFTLDGAGGVLQPHFALTEHSNQAPPTVSAGDESGAVSVEHFALVSGRHNLIVRDARNTGTSQHVGSDEHRYLLASEQDDRAPVAMTIPERVSATLTTPYSVATFAFTLAQITDVRIEIFAQRKEPASDLDSRLSLFRVDDDAYLITNDDQALDVLDSLATGELPPGQYVVVVDSVDPSAADLSFELDLSAQ